MSLFLPALAYGPNAVKADLQLSPTGWWGLSGKLVVAHTKVFLVTPLSCTELKPAKELGFNWKNGTERKILSVTRIDDQQVKIHATYKYDEKSWQTDITYDLNGSYKWSVAKRESNTIDLSHALMLAVGVASIFFLAGTVVGSRR